MPNQSSILIRTPKLKSASCLSRAFVSTRPCSTVHLRAASVRSPDEAAVGRATQPRDPVSPELDYRRPGYLSECISDVLVGLAYLESFGKNRSCSSATRWSRGGVQRGCDHLDEMAVVIGRKGLWLWRAVDNEGEILDLLVQPQRDKAAALRLMRKLLKKQGYPPTVLVTDRLASYGCARRRLGMRARHVQGLRKNKPHRKLAPGGETTRTEDAAVQVDSISAALLSAHAAVHNAFPPR
jgi:transposase-like protein